MTTNRHNWTSDFIGADSDRQPLNRSRCKICGVTTEIYNHGDFSESGRMEDELDKNEICDPF